MSGMRTVILTLSLLFVPSLTVADLGSSTDRLRTFSACAGRLSAQMEFQWMFDGPESELTQSRRADMIALVDALMQPDQGQQVLQWRLEAKHAHSALLTRATFNEDPEDAAWALSRALAGAADCQSLLLS